MSVYEEILNLLNKPVVSRQVVFAVIELLDDYTCNPIHDQIFDLLFEFLLSENNTLIESAKLICLNNM